MNRSKLALALVIVAAIGVAVWLWGFGHDVQPAVSPTTAAIVDEAHVAPETMRGEARVEASPAATREAAGATSTAASELRPTHDLTVRGHVYVQGSKIAIDGADVTACEVNGIEFASATSDEHGAYEIALPGGAPNPFALRTTHAEFATAWIDTIPSDVGDIEVDIELDRPFVIAVDVWTPQGKPCVGAELELWSPKGAFHDESLDGLSDSAGHFEFEASALPRTGLELSVRADGCATWLMTDLALEPGVRRRNIVCHLEQPLVLRGRVVDAAKRQPIAGAEIEILPNPMLFQVGGDEARTDALGFFEVGLGGCPIEAARLYARAEGFRAGRLDLLSRSAPLEIELPLPATLRGRLQSRSGQPLTGASVELAASQLRLDSFDEGIVRADGSFEIALAHVPYGGAWLLCEAREHVSKSIGIIAADCRGDECVIVTLDPVVRLHGRVRRANDSHPMPGITVRLLSKARSVFTSTDTRGDYEFELAAADMREARLAVELSGQRLAVVELEAPKDSADLERDIEVELKALPQKR